jgi:hypothetical protein
MEVASEKRRAQDPIGNFATLPINIFPLKKCKSFSYFYRLLSLPIFVSFIICIALTGEARRQREVAEDRAEKKKREREEAGEPSSEKTRVLSVTLEQVRV